VFDFSGVPSGCLGASDILINGQGRVRIRSSGACESIPRDKVSTPHETQILILKKVSFYEVLYIAPFVLFQYILGTLRILQNNYFYLLPFHYLQFCVIARSGI